MRDSEAQIRGEIFPSSVPPSGKSIALRKINLVSRFLGKETRILFTLYRRFAWPGRNIFGMSAFQGGKNDE